MEELQINMPEEHRHDVVDCTQYTLDTDFAVITSHTCPSGHAGCAFTAHKPGVYRADALAYIPSSTPQEIEKSHEIMIGSIYSHKHSFERLCVTATITHEDVVGYYDFCPAGHRYCIISNARDDLATAVMRRNFESIGTEIVRYSEPRIGRHHYMSASGGQHYPVRQHLHGGPWSIRHTIVYYRWLTSCPQGHTGCQALYVQYGGRWYIAALAKEFD